MEIFIKTESGFVKPECKIKTESGLIDLQASLKTDSGFSQLETNPYGNKFVTEWDMTSQGNIVSVNLPLMSPEVASEYNIIVEYDFVATWYNEDKSKSGAKHITSYYERVIENIDTDSKPFTIEIEGKINGFNFRKGDSTHGFNIIGVLNWGSLELSNISMYGTMRNYTFYRCENLKKVDCKDLPDFSSITSLYAMFYRCLNLESISNLDDWDVSNITCVKNMFYQCEKFNSNLNNWDVSNVTDMNSLFSRCNKFNSNLNNWDVSNVTDMRSLFKECKIFNQDIGNWDVSNVTDMNSLFYGCEIFNQDLSDWDVSNVTEYYMFDVNTFAWEEQNKPKIPE